MSALQTLIEKKAEIDAQIDEMRVATKADAIAEVKRLLALHDLKIEDIAKLGMRKVAPEYRDAAGNTWTGRGQKPVWLRNVLAAGVPLDALRINR